MLIKSRQTTTLYPKRERERRRERERERERRKERETARDQKDPSPFSYA